MNVDETSSFNICEFLTSKSSVLESLKYVKISDSLLINLNKYIDKTLSTGYETKLKGNFETINH